MTVFYLLDTNIIFDITRDKPHLGVQRRIAQFQDKCALAAPTVEEMVFGIARLPDGIRKSKLSQWLDGALASFPVLPYDEKGARWLGAERARLSALGRTAPRTDGEIAAVAATMGLVLVTRNWRDFAPYAGLSVENWFSLDDVAEK